MRKIKRNIWRKKREKEGKADIVESHRQAAIKQEIKKRSRETERERKGTTNNKKTTGMHALL